MIAAASSSKPIGIEDNYFGPLRLAKRPELHELLESARKATGVWLFAFKPNDLLADKNEAIASFM